MRRSRVSGKSSLRNFSTAVQKCMGDVKMTSFDLAIKFHLSTVLQQDHETLVLNAGYEILPPFLSFTPFAAGCHLLSTTLALAAIPKSPSLNDTSLVK